MPTAPLDFTEPRFADLIAYVAAGRWHGRSRHELHGKVMDASGRPATTDTIARYARQIREKLNAGEIFAPNGAGRKEESVSADAPVSPQSPLVPAQWSPSPMSASSLPPPTFGPIVQCAGIHFREITFPSEYDFIELRPITDTHEGSTGVMKTALDGLMRFIIADPRRFTVLLGDHHNTAIIGGKSDVYSEECTVDEAISRNVTRYGGPFASRVLAGITGNHEQRAWKSVGFDIMRSMMKQLGIIDRYHLFSAGLIIRMGPGGRTQYLISLHHGATGGATAGAALNGVMKGNQRISNADVYIEGHRHKTAYTPDSPIVWDWATGTPIMPKRRYVQASSFVAYGGYALEKGMPIVPQGDVPKIKFYADERNVEVTWQDRLQ